MYHLRSAGVSVGNRRRFWGPEFVGGTDKTATIGKLAAKFADEGRQVTPAAGDRFRAAAGRHSGRDRLVMAKLDGATRGGEQMEDLEPFEARDFARAIVGLE